MVSIAKVIKVRITRRELLLWSVVYSYHSLGSRMTERWSSRLFIVVGSLLQALQRPLVRLPYLLLDLVAANQLLASVKY